VCATVGEVRVALARFVEQPITRMASVELVADAADSAGPSGLTRESRPAIRSAVAASGGHRAQQTATEALGQRHGDQRGGRGQGQAQQGEQP